MIASRLFIASLLLPLLAVAAEDPVTLQLTVAADTAPWRTLDCAGSPITLLPDKPLPPCVTFLTPKGAKLQIISRAGAVVAGASGSTRAVYCGPSVPAPVCKPRTSRTAIGPRLGTLTVGTASQPLGYFCDPTDTVKSSGTVYSYLTDDAIPVALRGYVAACTT